MIGKMLPLVLTLFLVTAHAQDGELNTIETADKVESTPADNFLASMASAGPASNSSQNLDMTSASMEAAITNLMLGKSAFGDTPMGGSVKKIRNLITKDMMPKVLAAHKADQKELLRLIVELKKCGSTKDRAERMLS